MYLISYDISSDRERNKIAKKLEDYGRRVQYSVFECSISRNRFMKLYRELIELMEDVENGNIRIYPIDSDTEKKTLIIGDVDEEDLRENEDVVFI